MKILVTGATGRIGANLVPRLLDKGHAVRSFVYPGDPSRMDKLDIYGGVETVYGDLRSADDVRKAVAGTDAIYHLAAAMGGPFDNRQYLDINVVGTLNILESVRELCPNLHRLVYASSEAVYWDARINGRYFESPITEDMTGGLYPDMPYLMTKWLGEELAMVYHYQYGVPTCVTRFSTVIDPSEFLNEAGLPNVFLYSWGVETCRSFPGRTAETKAFADALIAGWDGEEKLLISCNPNGVPYRQHYGDVRDIAQGLELALDNPAAVGEIYNLSGAAILDWGELAPFFAERKGMPVVEARLPFNNYFELDLSKIKRDLGFAPQHDFDSILATAEAIQRGEATGVIPTGVRYSEE